MFKRTNIICCSKVKGYAGTFIGKMSYVDIKRSLSIRSKIAFLINTSLTYDISKISISPYLFERSEKLITRKVCLKIDVFF